MGIVKKITLFIIIAAMIIIAFPGCDLYKLSSSSNPDGSGIINPASGSYEKGVVVNVKVVPNAGYRFDHWEGGTSGTSANVQITMDKSKNLVAYFKKTYTLSATSSPNNGGNISPATGTYDEGSTVTLIANPNQYYKFNGWAGDASGNSDHLTITMNSNKQVIASFNKLNYSIQTQVQPTGAGTVDPDTSTVEAGIQKTITAVPTNSYRFDHWGGSATGSSNKINILV